MSYRVIIFFKGLNYIFCIFNLSYISVMILLRHRINQTWLELIGIKKQLEQLGCLLVFLKFKAGVYYNTQIVLFFAIFGVIQKLISSTLGI